MTNGCLVALHEEIAQCAVVYDIKCGIAHFYHHVMKTAMFFVAILTTLVEIEAYTGKHGYRPVDETDDRRHFYFLRTCFKEVASTLPFFAVKDVCFLKFEKNIFKEF